jgi:hypothetical protein
MERCFEPTAPVGDKSTLPLGMSFGGAGVVGAGVVGAGVVGGVVVGGVVVGGPVVGGVVGVVPPTVIEKVVEATTPERIHTVYSYVPAAVGAVTDAGPAVLPVTFAPLPEIQYPTGLVPPVKASATVKAAPAAGVALLGVAFTEPPAVWHPVQALPMVGMACAGAMSTVAAKSPTASADASSATFGTVFFLRPDILNEPPIRFKSYRE